MKRLASFASDRCARSHLVIVVICVLQSACTGNPHIKVDDDGIYRFPNHPIEVLAPDRCLLEMWLTHSEQMVGFITGRGYWDASGRYAVHVFPLPADVSDTAGFEARTERFLEKFLTGEPRQFNVRPLPVSQQSLTIAGNPAIQAIAVDPGRAVFVVTVRRHDTRVTAASLLYPLEGTRAPEEQLPWPCYTGFVESIREVPPGQPAAPN